MAVEIERKFLLKDDSWRGQASAGEEYRQGYLHADPSLAVRVRCAGDEAFLTIKGASKGIARLEFEYAIPRADAEEMLEHLCLKPLIEKRRHLLKVGGHTWEIDVFHGANAGLVIAEIELSRVDEEFQHPAWLGQEVSQDPRYYNAYLSRHPYREWKEG